MSSSREEAIARLRKWMETKAPITVSFSGRGLSFHAKGKIILDPKHGTVSLVTWVGDVPRPIFHLSLSEAVPCESFDTLRDAPETHKFSLPFVAAEAFRLPYGDVDFREVAPDEDED